MLGGGHGHGRDHGRGRGSRVVGRRHRAEGPDRLWFVAWVSLNEHDSLIDKAMLDILILQAKRLYHSASGSSHNCPRLARGAATWNCGGSCFVLGRSLGRNRDHSLDHGLGRGILLCKSGAACRRRTLWRREMRKTGCETRKRKETEKKVGRLDGLNWAWLGWDKVGAKDDVEPRCARRHPKQGSFAFLGDPSLWTLPGGPWPIAEHGSGP